MFVSPTAGYVSVLVVRAQGLVDTVTAEWQTVDGTAQSTGKLQPDFLVSFHLSRLKTSRGANSLLCCVAYQYMTISSYRDSRFSVDSLTL